MLFNIIGHYLFLRKLLQQETNTAGNYYSRKLIQQETNTAAQSSNPITTSGAQNLSLFTNGFILYPEKADV